MSVFKNTISISDMIVSIEGLSSIVILQWLIQYRLLLIISKTIIKLLAENI